MQASKERTQLDRWSLRGRSALITGAASGVGAATASLFAAAGADVVLLDVREPELLQQTQAIASTEAKVFSVVADLRSPEDCSRAVEEAAGKLGKLDILVNNAAVGTIVVGGTVESISLEHWDLAQDVNLRAAYLLSRAAIPHMRSAGRGSIVNIASLGALQGSKPYPSHAYAASKGGLIALTKVMAVTYGQDGIRVNVICPGLINTRLAVNAVPKATSGDTPLRRAAEPDEIAHAILFLASDASSFVTGSNFVVDGGAHAVVTY